MLNEKEISNIEIYKLILASYIDLNIQLSTLTAFTFSDENAQSYIDNPEQYESDHFYYCYYYIRSSILHISKKLEDISNILPKNIITCNNYKINNNDYVLIKHLGDIYSIAKYPIEFLKTGFILTSEKIGDILENKYKISVDIIKNIEYETINHKIIQHGLYLGKYQINNIIKI